MSRDKHNHENQAIITGLNEFRPAPRFGVALHVASAPSLPILSAADLVNPLTRLAGDSDIHTK